MKSNNNINYTTERTQFGIFLCVHINNKQVMKADVSNLKNRTIDYMGAKIVRAIHKTLEIK